MPCRYDGMFARFIGRGGLSINQASSEKAFSYINKTISCFLVVVVRLSVSPSSVGEFQMWSVYHQVVLPVFWISDIQESV